LPGPIGKSFLGNSTVRGGSARHRQKTQGSRQPQFHGEKDFLGHLHSVLSRNFSNDSIFFISFLSFILL